MPDFTDLADVLCSFKQLVWVVIALTTTLLILSAFSAFIGGLSEGAMVVLTLSTAINGSSLLIGVAVLLLCRRHDRPI
ncbi:hypothetical protein [Halocatena marina]|uniref:Uncharacterized protein n=1 Tax=Halocatena marina TaxID=2934937 RepID=A0ABD5YSZ5_9EURY|nr:hypothetical protein [Halocatena marina]